MSTPATPPTKASTAPAEFEPIKLAKKALWIVIIIIALVKIRDSKGELKHNPGVEQQQQVESSLTVAPSVVHVQAGKWLDLYPERDSKMHVQPIESGVTCVYMINDDPRQWRSPDEHGRNADLSEKKLGVTIWRVRVQPVNKDATFLTTSR
jgi:hypothetical protein